jgi:hypothetical protein
MKFEHLLTLILKTPELEDYSFSGNCFSMAYALHMLIPDSKIVVSCNERLLKEKKRYVGHCGIKFNGLILDGEGLMPEDDFLSWGMLDDTDYSYIEGTSITKKEWSKEAFEAVIIEASPEDILYAVDLDTVNKIKDLINEKNNEYYAVLADMISDHVWNCSGMKTEFLHNFSEFLYQGIGYRLLILKNKKSKIKSLENQSFSKSIKGVQNFIDNYKDEDLNSYESGHKRLLKANITGFDVHKAITFLYENKLGITQSTFDKWNSENEIIAFEVNDVKEINLTEKESR